VLDEVAAYSFWGEYQDSLAIDGIFVDETPTQYSPDTVAYLQTIADAIHESDGLKEGYIGKVTFHLGTGDTTAPPEWIPAADRLLLHWSYMAEHDFLEPPTLVLAFGTPAIIRVQGWQHTVVHNPGALPVPQFFEAPTSTSTDLTVVFENSFSNWTAENLALAEATRAYNRTKLAIVVHSVPELSAIELSSTLKELLAVGHSLWLTGDSNYTNFDAHFPVFVASLAALLKWSLAEADVAAFQNIGL
jgi:hypothetical protein